MTTNSSAMARGNDELRLARRPQLTRLSRHRNALLGSAASIAALSLGPSAALAACVEAGSANGIIIYECSGTINGTNAPAVQYSSTVSAFEILSTGTSVTISTTGAHAYGIYGYGEGPYVYINSSGSIRTTGDFAHGAVTIGRNNYSVSYFDGSITTGGANAYGVHAQTSGTTNLYAGITSIGTVTTTGSGSHGLHAATDAEMPAVPASINGTIDVLARSHISTTGNEARGIYADNLRGGFAGSGNVWVGLTGSITTAGNFAEGILVNNRAAGQITIVNQGAIATAGTSSHGIYASNGFVPSSDGNISVTSSGTIGTHGASSDGIHVDAAGASGNVSIAVTGRIETTSASSMGIYVRANGGNASVVVGGGGSVSSHTTAIDMSGLSANLSNSGTINGNVYINAQNGSFINGTGSTLNAGADIYFGAYGGMFNNGTMTNSGTLSPGGAGVLRTTTLTGDFVQTSGGRLAIDTNWQTGTSDLLAVTGTATIAGTVLVNPINLGSQAGLTRTFTILTAAGGIIDNGITIANTAAVTYGLVRPDANTLNVNAAIDFRGNAGTNLNSNQRSIGSALNSTFAAGGSLGFMPALLTLDSSTYGAALSQLAPTGDAAAFAGAIQTGNTFANHLLSCRVAGESREANRFIREGQCVWARISARRLENEGRSDSIGFSENSSFFSAGAQLKLQGDWRIGAGLGYEQASTTANSKATNLADRLHVGGVVKYNPGPWLLAAGVTGGKGWNDSTRRISFGGFSSVATSDSETSFVTGRLTAAYLMSRGDWYLKPQIEIASTRLMRDSYTEHAAGGVALRVARTDANVTSLSPSVEVGAEHSFQGAMYRAFVRGGASFRDKDTFVTTASFADAGGGAPFTTASRIDRMTADIGAGVDITMHGSTNVRVQYDGQIGQRTTSHSGSAKVSVPF